MGFTGDRNESIRPITSVAENIFCGRDSWLTKLPSEVRGRNGQVEPGAQPPR
jgi:hypothetical protein